VARTDEFRTLAREVAMQVASSPDLRTVGSMAGDGDEDETVLLDQSYIRDHSKTIRDLVREAIGKLGENIQVSRFARFEVGKSDEQDDSDQTTT